jgi:nucleotide-binding universal stress UspA family protein
MTMHRILAPVTFAEDSLEASTVAAELAEALGAELVLLGIAPLVQPEAICAPDDLEALQRSAREQRLLDHIVGERLKEFADSLPAAVRRRTRLAYGAVGAALVDAARDERADLMVVPIRREHELAHLFHDHADRYVLHHSSVPVLVVPTPVGSDKRHESRCEAA